MLGPTFRADTRAPLLDWLDRNTDRLHLPSVGLVELEAGIAKLRRAGSTRKAVALEEWLVSLLRTYADRILVLDTLAALATGRLLDKAIALGRPPGFADLAIAGIAEAHGMVVLTRNLRHFAPLGVLAHDPYAALPD